MKELVPRQQPLGTVTDDQNGRGLSGLTVCSDVARNLSEAKSSALFQPLPYLISKQTLDTVNTFNSSQINGLP